MLHTGEKRKALRRGAGQKGTRRDRSEEENRISLVTVKNVFIKEVVQVKEFFEGHLADLISGKAVWGIINVLHA